MLFVMLSSVLTLEYGKLSFHSTNNTDQNFEKFKYHNYGRDIFHSGKQSEINMCSGDGFTQTKQHRFGLSKLQCTLSFFLVHKHAEIAR